ncbi:MAG: arylsulfatase [Deltaproteobacteria bacterium]|nr:arylsulfatase [Deltaproteobacteria bacterium]
MEEKSNQPNIVVILADDMGFSDIGCYGSEISTPHLDRLAENGVRFTQMYNCARCCPSRASLLTGLYPHQAGIGHMTRSLGSPPYQGFLNDNCVTIAEALKLGGYQTLMSGKWHVGGEYDPQKPEDLPPGADKAPIPINRGFDRFYGTITGAVSYFKPRALMLNDKAIEPEGENYYFTDAITERAVEMIETGGKKPEPFFLYVSYTAPHWPLHAFPEDIARYEGRYRRGWDRMRTDRHERLIELGILSSKWEISPRTQGLPSFSKAPNQDWEDLRMAVYAAQIDRMDQGIGRIMSKLKELEIEENTLIMFMSDNGGCAEFLAESGWTENFSSTTPQGKPVIIGNLPDLKPGPAETFMSYDMPWANVSNTPFRLYKHWVHEGGISTPLIVKWPAVVKSSRIVHPPTHFIDIMATCLDAAGVDYPEEFNDQPITPLEGESLVPALKGETWSRQKPLIWEHEGNCAVRQGPWKLVRENARQWELYDIREDRTELNDLAKKNQPRVEEMAAHYNEWAERVKVMEWKEEWTKGINERIHPLLPRKQE